MSRYASLNRMFIFVSSKINTLGVEFELNACNIGFKSKDCLIFYRIFEEKSNFCWFAVHIRQSAK